MQHAAPFSSLESGVSISVQRRESHIDSFRSTSEYRDRVGDHTGSEPDPARRATPNGRSVRLGNLVYENTCYELMGLRLLPFRYGTLRCRWLYSVLHSSTFDALSKGTLHCSLLFGRKAVAKLRIRAAAQAVFGCSSSAQLALGLLLLRRRGCWVAALCVVLSVGAFSVEKRRPERRSILCREASS